MVEVGEDDDEEEALVQKANFQKNEGVKKWTFGFWAPFLFFIPSILLVGAITRKVQQ